MDNVMTLFAKGETRYGGVNIPDSTEWDTSVDNSNRLEGTEADVQYETRKTVAGVQSAPRNFTRRIKIVRNAGATTLQAGDVVKWSTGYIGRRVEKNDSAETKCAGVVIDLLTSNGCVQYDMCAIVIIGWNYCTKTALDGGITAGDRLHGTATGTVATMAAPSSDQEALDFALNVVGTCITTAATALTTVLCDVCTGRLP